MDRDKDAKLTFDEFVEGSKQDPTIVQVCYRLRVVACRMATNHCIIQALSLYDGLV